MKSTRKLNLLFLPIFLLCFTGTTFALTTTFTDQALFLGQFGTSITEDFEGFSAGVVITNQLTGINMVATDGDKGSIQAEIGSISGLPFPMTGGLPTSSGDKFLSSELAPNIYAQAGLIFNLDMLYDGVGFFVVDGAPLGGFEINLFDGMTLIGSDVFAAQTLPNSFTGVSSTLGFDRVVIDSVHDNDSWGIDDLTIGKAAPVPEPATMLLLGSGLIGLAGFRRRFRKR